MLVKLFNTYVLLFQSPYFPSAVPAFFLKFRTMIFVLDYDS